jgi:hypothetical protein
MTRNHSRLAIATIVGVLLLAASASQAGGATVTGPVRVDLTASAQPHAGYVPDTDVAFHVDVEQGVGTHAATTATASSICPGCSGQAVSVQVLYLGQAPASTLDNVAVAWDQGCTLCTATAVSVQVVVVNVKGPLSVNNRALAVDAACKWCRARSGAYQVVVSGNADSRLSDAALSALKAWATQRARLLRDPSTSGRQTSPTAKQNALDSLKALVNADLGSHTMAARARVASR